MSYVNSHSIEIVHFDRTTSDEVNTPDWRDIGQVRIPEVVVSDNGPQYSSEAYAAFVWQFRFEHVTSSPR